MSPLISREKKGKNIRPKMMLVDGANKLILARSKVNLIKLYLCYNMGKSKEEQFNLVVLIPNNDETIIISAPIPIKTAWVLYCNFTDWVHAKDLPSKIWKHLK